MPTLNESLALAVQHHRAGNLPEAERLYREILAAQPNHPQPWHLLGLIANQVGKSEVAISCLERALALQPDYAEAHCDLGTALSNLGRPIDAIAHYQRATLLKPRYAEAHYNLANALREQGQTVEAIEAYRRAVEINPDFADGHHNLAILLHDRGELVDAIASLRRALELDAQSAEGHYKLATWLKQQQDLAGAIAAYRRAMELKPRYVEACTDLGVALHEQGQLDEALECHRQALAWNPDSFEVHNNLGTVYQDLTKLDLALFHYGQALTLKPDSAETHVNLGITYKWLGQLDEAWKSYHRALDQKPDYAAAHVGIAALRLIRGDFEQGWPQFEWRWKTGQLPPRDFSQATWDGRPLPAGTTILLHSEQGLGDAIQFARYAELVKAGNPAATVILECEPPLRKLFASLRGVDRIVVHGEALPPFDTHAPLLSLPRILNTRIETIPRSVPYLAADPALVAQWREKLASIARLRVGVNWHGREGHRVAQLRDLPLDQLAALARAADVQLLSLQKGADPSELARHSIGYLGDDFDQSHGAFMDTAAVMMNLDLVITSDTSVAHLAGALGVTVWVALPFAADWRWLLDRSDSPWYPTMKLFRQKSRGDWQSVFGELSTALAIVAAHCRSGYERRSVK